MSNKFEYEERYKVIDVASIQKLLEVNGFRMTSEEIQSDHWFIPKEIMTPDEQAQWFDFDRGFALRIREQVKDNKRRTIITSKQLLHPADHSAMANYEAELTPRGMQEVLAPMGQEFNRIIQEVATYRNDEYLSLHEAKILIEKAGRKDYIVIDKQRSTYLNAAQPEVIADLDYVPALNGTDLGFAAAIELEYVGPGTIEEAKSAVRAVSSRLGFEPDGILAMALPGLAIKYLAVF